MRAWRGWLQEIVAQPAAIEELAGINLLCLDHTRTHVVKIFLPPVPGILADIHEREHMGATCRDVNGA
jgi:hypothetical protein